MSDITTPAQIAEWVAEATPEAATKLRDCAESTDDKEIRKAVRRALYLLSQKRILPLPRAPVAATAAPTQAQLLALHAWGSTIDGAGNRMLFFLLPNSDGGNSSLLQLLFNDEAGVKDFGLRRISRREWDEMFSHFAEQLDNGMGMAELDPDYARALVTEARELNRRNRTQTPPGFLDLLPRIGSPQQEHTPPIYALLSPEEVHADETIPKDPQDLFALPWFESWFLDAEETHPYLNVMTEDVKAQMDHAGMQEAFEAGIREATRELMPSERRLLFARRLEETAYVLWQGGKQAEARQAVYQALELRDNPKPITGFSSLLVTRTMRAAVQMVKQGETTASIRAEQGL